jgi:hypothetical protein
MADISNRGGKMGDPVQAGNAAIISCRGTAAKRVGKARLVILSAAKDLAERCLRFFAALRMTTIRSE